MKTAAKMATETINCLFKPTLPKLSTPTSPRAAAAIRPTTASRTTFINVATRGSSLWLMPHLFHLPQLGNISTLLMFLLPLLLAVVFFAMTVGNVFVRQKISPMLCFVFFSLVLFFITGMVWPQSNMPRWIYALSQLFPSTPGVQGFVKISSMGATLAEVKNEYLLLWLQTAVYFATASLSLRFIKRYRG